MTEDRVADDIDNEVASDNDSPRINPAIAVCMVVLLVLMSALAIRQQGPPDALPENAAANEFSAVRAMKLIGVIATQPHTMGVPAHSQVRDQMAKALADIGVEPQIQKTSVNSQRKGAYFQAGMVENIVGLLKGTQSGQAVLLAAHYDSAPASYGASDDGVGVAALLEVARALKAGPALKNDVIFLFSDGEENGLLGAKAFVEEHPLAKEVSLVLNFDARGNSGPSLMFESSDQNGRLIRELRQTAPYPRANSISFDVYKLLPNDTDFTIFKNAGYAGLNFAYIGGSTHHHTLTDTADNVDGRSLQHHGSYALSLTRHFGEMKLSDLKAPNATFFNLFGSTMLAYSSGLNIVATFVVLILFLAVVIVGLVRKRLRLPGLVFGFIMMLATLVISPIVVTILWRIIATIHKGYQEMVVNTYNSTTYEIAFVAIAIAIFSAFVAMFRSRIAIADLAVGAMIWWLLLAIATNVVLRGGNYLFAWPLFFSLIGVALSVIPAKQSFASAKSVVILCLCAVPGILLLSPVIDLLYVAMGQRLAGPMVVIVVLLLGLLVPHISLITGSGKKWTLPALSLLVGVGFIVAGSVTSGFDSRHPKPVSLFYLLDSAKGKALWASADVGPDQWTRNFISPPETRAKLDEYLPTGNLLFLQGEAPVASLAPADVKVIEDATSGDTRTLRMQVSSPIQAPVVSVFAAPGTEILGASINGKPVSDDPRAKVNQQDGWGFSYWAVPPEGFELLVQLKAPQQLKLNVVERLFSLPDLPGASYPARPADRIPAPRSYGISTLVHGSYTF